MMSSEKKKYKVYIDYQSEVEAENENDAIIKANDDFYFNYTDIDEAMSLINVEEIKNDK